MRRIVILFIYATVLLIPTTTLVTTNAFATALKIPDFVTLQQKSIKGSAVVHLTTLNSIGSQHPVDFKLEFINSNAANRIGNVYYDFKAIQQNKVVYENIGVSKDGTALVTPTFFQKGPAKILIAVNNDNATFDVNIAS